MEITEARGGRGVPAGVVQEILSNPLVRWDRLERREYQVELAALATGENLLCILPTALGKTVVAELAAAHFLLHHWDRRVLVMAPTRPLVLQHRSTFLRDLRLRPGLTAVVTGEVPPAERAPLWSSGVRVFFSTPQTVQNDLGRVDLSSFSLLVFDEAHHCRKNYAYGKVAEAYLRACGDPHILALTASPGSTEERVREMCSRLGIERVEARGEGSPEVLPYVNPVRVEYREVELPEPYLRLSSLLQERWRGYLRELEARHVLPKPAGEMRGKDVVELSKKLQSQAEAEPHLWEAVKICTKAMGVFRMRSLAESQGREAAVAYLKRLAGGEKRSHRELLAEMLGEGIHRAVLGLPDHPKLEALGREVLLQRSTRPGSRIMVFTQYRDTARALVERLRGWGVPAERFVGQASRGEDEGMDQGEQERILSRFREGEVECLVCTQVGEEGIDVPSCDLVVFYEPVPSEIRFIQRKGRTGRVRAGRVVVLVSGPLDRAARWQSLRRERMMREIVERLNAQLSPLPRTPVPEVRMPEGEMLREGPDRPHPEGGGERRAGRGLLERVGRGEEVPLSSLEGEEAEAAARLVGEGVLAVRGGLLVPPEEGTSQVEVVRILPGAAVVRVDGKTYAVMEAEDYSGPPGLVRKGAVFRARCELYQRGDRKFVRVRVPARVV